MLDNDIIFYRWDGKKMHVNINKFNNKDKILMNTIKEQTTQISLV